MLLNVFVCFFNPMGIVSAHNRSITRIAVIFHLFNLFSNVDASKLDTILF